MLCRITSLVLLCLLACPLLAQPEGKKSQQPGTDPAKPAATVEDPDEAADDENIPRVVPAFDPGSHTQPICALGFTADKRKLITVGEDASIQVWSTSTGERLDILRLPAFGHEQVSRLKAWNVAAVSHDGRFVAIGGGQRFSLSEGNQSDRAKLLLVDVGQRTVQPIRSPQGVVTAVAFSPDNRLAVAYNGSPADIVLINENDRRRQRTVLSAAGMKQSANSLHFSPDGKHLLAGYGETEAVLWELGTGQPTIKKRFASKGNTSAVAWSPDRQRFVRGMNPGLKQGHGFEVRSAAGELIQDYQFSKLAGFDVTTDLRFITFLDPQTLLVSASDAQGRSQPGSCSFRFDLTAGAGKLVYNEPSAGRFNLAGATTADNELAAVSVSTGLDAVVYRVKDGSLVARCGAASPVPTLVGWADKDRPAGFAWSEERHNRRFNTVAADLQFGFDLAQMEPVAALRAIEYGVRLDSIRDWSIRTAGPTQFNFQQGETHKGSVLGGYTIIARTLVPPPGADPPLRAGASVHLRTARSQLALSKSDGSLVTRLWPDATFIRDVAPSPDGRFVVVSTGSHRLQIYTTDGQKFPLLSFARVNGEWVIWSREGYFAASPGGEKLFGWAVSNGPFRMSTFHPAEKFGSHFRRPELLKRAIQLGSIEAALKQEEVRAPAVEQLLPPRGELKLIKQTDGKVQVQASAVPGSPDKPVVAMRLLLDGRPLGSGAGVKNVATGEKAEVTWELDIPAGSHELKLLVRGSDSSAVSDPLTLKGPKSDSQIPVLHRLCVGVDQYKLPALNLSSAVKDANDVYASLEKNCVGENNRFGKVNGPLLTNSQATAPAVLKAIADIRRVAKSGDLVVFLFAGHGIQQQEVVKLADGSLRQRSEYYLMTHEADPSQSLKGKSLSGAELRQALGPIQCPVLLVMDSCHSASGVKAFRPAVDDLTRGLTDDATGVTVLAAAMSHEVASATAENGYFTAAFLKALEAGHGVPYDPHDHALYTHHIYSVIFSEVRRATGGKQNPFLNMPWTVPPLALRDVPRN